MNYENQDPYQDTKEEFEDPTPDSTVPTNSIENMFPVINIGKRDKGVTITTARSGGAGGQNVNKRETKAVLYLNIAETDRLTLEQKKVLMCHGCLPHANDALKRAWNRITAGGVLMMTNQESRTIEANIENAINNLNSELNEALTPRVPRKEGQTKQVKAKIRRQKEQTKQIKFKKEKDSLRSNYN